MILTDATHAFTVSACSHTGQPCMEGLWLARRIALALAARAAVLDSGYDVTCAVRFVGCGRVCPAVLRVRPAEVQMRCGVDAEARLADPARGGTPPALATLVARPRAAAIRLPPALAAE